MNDEHLPSSQDEPPEKPTLIDVSQAQGETTGDVRTTLVPSELSSCSYASVTCMGEDTATVVITANNIFEPRFVDDLGTLLFSLVDTYGYKDVTIDFANVGHFSSDALGKLITLDKKIRTCGRGKEQEGELAVVHLINMKPEIAEVFYITRLDRLFDVQEKPDEEPQRVETAP